MSRLATPNNPDPSAEHDSRWLHDVAASRRTVLLGGAAAISAVFLAPAGTAAAGASTSGKRPKIGFAALPAGLRADTVTVPEGYQWAVLAPWGDPIGATGPAFTPGPDNTAAAQELQMGMHHDGMHYFPISTRRGRQRGLLVMNHEYIDETLLFGYPDDDSYPPLTSEQLALSMAAHGVSVIEIHECDGVWSVVDSHYARRITADTPMAFSGPVAADHSSLDTGAEPRGTFNNCAMGYTPWGTYLTCEENFDGYFGATGEFAPTAVDERYDIAFDNWSYAWFTAPESRFDLTTNPNEPNRFGWVVEIDPFDPASTPIKRSALGRCKHEGAFAHTSRSGHAVVYMGDDQDGEYLYKFVSAEPWRRMVRRGRSPLDEGRLYVAVFNDDGTGAWLPLVHGEGPLTVENGWADQAAVLIGTRLAADALGATRLDRPEWTTVDRRSGACFVALTNGSGDRGPTSGSRGEATDGNRFGQVLRWYEAGCDHTATEFEWDIFVFAGDPTQPVPDTTVDDEDRFGSPDGLWADDRGRLWIQTDISGSRIHAGVYERIGNNQMLCADPDNGEIRRFLSGPEGCEITGVTMTPDGRTMFVNVQHPGESFPSTFPFGDIPRSCTVVVRRDDGGRIGT
jgi:uncharacterized protein